MPLKKKLKTHPNQSKKKDPQPQTTPFRAALTSLNILLHGSKAISWSSHPKVGRWRFLNSLFSCKSHSTNNPLTVPTTGDDATMTKSFDLINISSICSPISIQKIKVSHINIYLSNGTGNSIIFDPQVSLWIQSYEGLQQTHSTSPGTSFTILPYINLTRNKSYIITITLLSLQSTAYKKTAYHLLHLPYLNHT